MERGVVEGFSAYLIWGLAPLFWKQLDDVSSADALGHRVVWTGAVLIVVHAIRTSWPSVRAAASVPRNRLTALATALLIAVNWGTFIWAVNDDRVIEASLGYFINPLVSVFLGVVILREHLRRVQGLAVFIASAGVVWLTVDVGSLPWVGLVLAASFGLYGLLRKTADFGALDGLTMEIGILAPVAAGYVVWRAVDGHGAMGTSRPSTTVLLLLTGAITAVPLLLFARAARQVTLVMVGLLQFVAPTLHFLIGWLVYDERVDRGRLVGYSFIWLALAVFTIENFVWANRSIRRRDVTSTGADLRVPMPDL